VIGTRTRSLRDLRARESRRSRPSRADAHTTVNALHDTFMHLDARRKVPIVAPRRICDGIFFGCSGQRDEMSSKGQDFPTLRRVETHETIFRDTTSLGDVMEVHQSVSGSPPSFLIS
jgi:hypothetical protein